MIGTVGIRVGFGITPLGDDRKTRTMRMCLRFKADLDVREARLLQF